MSEVSTQEEFHAYLLNYINKAILKIKPYNNNHLLNKMNAITDLYYFYMDDDIDIYFIRELIYGIILSRNRFIADDLKKEFPNVNREEFDSFLGVDIYSYGAEVINKNTDEQLAAKITNYLSKHQEDENVWNSIYEKVSNKFIKEENITKSLSDIHNRFVNSFHIDENEDTRKFYLKDYVRRNIYNSLPQMDLYHKRLCDYINKMRIQPEIPDLGIKCKFCGSKRVKSKGDKQIRSVDEASTIYFQCYDCEKWWMS